MTENWQNWNDEKIVNILEKDWNENMQQRLTLHEVLDELADVLSMIDGCEAFHALLDAGCGTCVSYPHLKDRYLYRGVDVTAMMIEKAREKFPEIHVEVKDILDLTEEDEAQVVLSCDVLIHTPSFEPYLKALWRVTERVLVLKLAYVWDRATRDDWDGKFYNRKFNLKDLVGALLSLKPAKLEIVRVGDDEKTTPEFFNYQVFVLWR